MINVVSNGMGAPSMALLVLASQGKLKVDYSITANTGSEKDMLMSDGSRMRAIEYLLGTVEPFCQKNNIKFGYPRAKDKDGKELNSIWDNLKDGNTTGVPMFGSNGGRLIQTCTGKYKIRAVRQFLRNEGIDKCKMYLGLTSNEIHRIKEADVKWAENWWPLIFDFKMGRMDCIRLVEGAGIIYPVNTQCDNCPHKDGERWLNTASWVIDELEQMEKEMPGLFFSNLRIPIRQAIKEYEKMEAQGDLFENKKACVSGYCFT